jgi:hypothetical protein
MGKTKTNNKGVTMKTIIEYKTVKVTQKEYDFLSDIANSDFSFNSDEDEVLDLVCEDTQYDMKLVRGLMGSLKKKGIISKISEEIFEDGSEVITEYWVYVSEVYGKDCQLTNLEVA